MDGAHHSKEGNAENLKSIAVNQNNPLEQRKQAVDALTEMDEEFELFRVAGMKTSKDSRTNDCEKIVDYTLEKLINMG